MRAAVLIFLGCVVSAAAVELPVAGTSFNLTKDQMAQCSVEGGCALVSKRQVERWQQEAFAAGRKYQKYECSRFL